MIKKRVIKSTFAGLGALFVCALILFAFKNTQSLKLAGARIIRMGGKPQDFAPKTPKHAVFDWQSLASMQASGMDSVFAALKAQGFDTVFVSINDAVDIMEVNDSNDRQQKLDLFETNLAAYIKSANSHGLAVYALAGAPDWANSSDWYLQDLALTFVQNYNFQASQKLAGLQFDIEPYYEQGYSDSSDNQKFMLGEYLSGIQKFLSDAENTSPDLKFGYVAPPWWSAENGQSPQLLWDGDRKYTMFHLLDLLGQYPNTYLDILAYRRDLAGSDGVFDLAAPEIDYIHKNSLATGYMIGQETGNVQPERITFYNHTRTELAGNIQRIFSQFAPDKNFEGVAVNDLDNYLKLQP